MTLQCNCGGAVTVTDATYGTESATETYECANCGDTGTLLMEPAGDTMMGCLTENNEY